MTEIQARAMARNSLSQHRDPPLRRAERIPSASVSLDLAWVELSANRPTPNATIEAVKQSVRDRGLAALKEIATRGRLAGFDAAARTELDRWLTHFKTKARG